LANAIWPDGVGGGGKGAAICPPRACPSWKHKNTKFGAGAGASKPRWGGWPGPRGIRAAGSLEKSGAVVIQGENRIRLNKSVRRRGRRGRFIFRGFFCSDSASCGWTIRIHWENLSGPKTATGQGQDDHSMFLGRGGGRGGQGCFSGRGPDNHRGGGHRSGLGGPKCKMATL